MLLRVKYLKHVSLYVKIDSSPAVLKLLNYVHPKPVKLKHPFIETPNTSSIALLYLA